MSEDPITEAVARAMFDWSHDEGWERGEIATKRIYMEDARAAIRALYGALEREGPSEDQVEAVARALAGTEHFDWTPENYDSAKSAEHYGDCTNIAQSCARCYCEEINEVATVAIRALAAAPKPPGAG